MDYGNHGNTDEQRIEPTDRTGRDTDKYSVYAPSGYPVKHKRKVPFGPTIKLGSDYRERFNDILKMDYKLDEMILTTGDYLDFVKDVCSSNIHWSTSIEGNPLSQEDVRRISTSFFDGEENKERRDGPTQEILNHLYSHIAADRFKMPWCIDTVKNTHRTLTERTGIAGSPGMIRTHESVIKDEGGFEYMVPCPAKHIDDELNSLIAWLEESPYDPLVTATLFFHEFESIHPFTDGNGRTGRTLFQILLQELGLKNSKLCRFEEKILGSLKTYYGLLGYTDQTQDYRPLVMYISESLHMAYKKAVEEFGKKNILNDLDEASKTLAIRSKRTSWFSISDASSWVSLGDQRISHKLNELVEMGVLEKGGKTKSTRFRFRDPFAYLKEASQRHIDAYIAQRGESDR
ncbi:MAG: Fic family protein [Methanomassiliicoccaceae archaeon]|nr:Fic family protein [Methanomassiliicoccaceae archaeon]